MNDQQLREIEVLVISAEGLKNVKYVTKMKPYAVAYVEKERHAARTRVDEDGETSPTWNELVTVKFRRDLPETDATVALTVEIYDEGRLKKKPVGTARLLLSDVLAGGGDAARGNDTPGRVKSVRVWTRSGRPEGLLNLWVPPTGRFCFRDSAAEKVVVRSGGG